ncbi:PucR family transcriptional regulator [Neobacillus drentensis]|uniref:PucR family transcriptional regulator n=1 Tax=Neobacillus drentensis TaxID=220684 RepID=UPI002FFEF0F8
MIKDQLHLTVGDILKRRHFENAQVIAGEKGIGRFVKWVHIVEVTSIRNLLNGNELILSTGVAWYENPDLFISMVMEFLENHAAGLCIELGTYMTEIPPEVIEIANLHHFPIIVFSHEVPFVQITLDIHTLIINQEKKRVEEFEWLYGWLEGDHSPESIAEYFVQNGIKTKTNEAVVLITKVPHQKEKVTQDVTYLKLLFRSALEQYGFTVFSVDKRNEVTFILVNNRSKKNGKERIKTAIESIIESEFIRKQCSAKLLIAAGSFTVNLHDVHKSYQTAKETQRIQQKISNKADYYFYEDLHLYRLISQMSKHINLQEMASEYLQPVIHYDQKYNGKLLETLKVYLECNGSKQEAANKLYIVRQTLYHRLQKLETILGDDFMEHEKRVAIEFMLLVEDYLASSQSILSNNKYRKLE